MNRDDAERLLGMLVGATSGWSNAPDETFVFYTQQLLGLRDLDAAEQAVRDVCVSWNEPRRPTIAAINTAYGAILRRRIDEQPALETRLARELPSVDVGRQIAARAYRDECAKRPANDPLVLSGYRSNTPNERHLTALLGAKVPGSQHTDPNSRHRRASDVPR